MTPHDDYTKEKGLELLILFSLHNNIVMREYINLTAEIAEKHIRDNMKKVYDIIEQIYQDGYRDGYDERQALGDLN